MKFLKIMLLVLRCTLVCVCIFGGSMNGFNSCVLLEYGILIKTGSLFMLCGMILVRNVASV
jgi:hypothetical protein